jgi:excisionase family DNA binding protein
MQSPVSKAEPAIEPLLLSLAASAEYLGLSRDTLYRLIGCGRLTALKHGSKTLVTVASLRDYVASLPEAKIKPPINHTAA